MITDPKGIRPLGVGEYMKYFNLVEEMVKRLVAGTLPKTQEPLGMPSTYELAKRQKDKKK